MLNDEITTSAVFTRNDKVPAHFAFTLAEVLITLAIIGVVAALTFPIFGTRVQNFIYENQYKKAKNTIANGYRMMLAKNDTTTVANLPVTDCTDSSCMTTEHSKAFKIASDTTTGLKAESLPSEYKVDSGDEVVFDWNNVPYIFSTTSGMTYGVERDEDLTSLSIYADTNTNKKPNSVYKDMYKFRVFADAKVIDVSEELLKDKCSDDPSACKTEEKCMAAGIAKVHPDEDGNTNIGGWLNEYNASTGGYYRSSCYKWQDNKCIVHPNASYAWYDGYDIDSRWSIWNVYCR